MIFLCFWCCFFLYFSIFFQCFAFWINENIKAFANWLVVVGLFKAQVVERPTEANKFTERYIFCTIFISLLWGSVFVDFFLNVSYLSLWFGYISIGRNPHRRNQPQREPRRAARIQTSSNVLPLHFSSSCKPLSFLGLCVRE